MTVESRWLDNLVERNKAFTARVDENSLPVARTPGRAALITCMDPRVNPEALGIDPFGSRGQGSSDVRIIRTIGGMAEDRSLIVGIHLAGIKEFAVVMHTDCGNCLAKQRIDKIADGLQATMAPEDFESFRDRLGDAWPASLTRYLKAFDDPREAVRQEVEAIRDNRFVPKDVIVHGLLYTLYTASLEVIVNGYLRA